MTCTLTNGGGLCKYIEESDVTSIFLILLFQKEIERHLFGETILSIILSMNKTQLTQFRDKTAYPMYMMIENILKDICKKSFSCAQILVAYLPAT